MPRRTPHRYCRRCRTRLALDNHGDRCLPCVRKDHEDRQHPPDIPLDHWLTDQFSDAFAAQHIGLVSAAYRHCPYHRTPITQDQLGTWLGMSQPDISRIESGPPIRNLDRLTYWARTLEIPPQLLWWDLPGQRRERTSLAGTATGTEEDGQGRNHGQSASPPPSPVPCAPGPAARPASASGAADHPGPAPIPAPGATGAVPSALRATTHPTGQQGGNPTDRRDFTRLAALAVGAAPGAAPLLTPADRLAALDRAATAGGAVTAAEGILDTITGDYLAYPPAAILGRVAALQALADNIQAEYLLKPADTARLWKVAAVAAGIRGWLENNAGNTAAARLSLREAHRFGDLIDDGQLIAWTRYMQAMIEDYAGDTDAAERYARDGLHHTSKRSSQRAVILGQVMCRAHATRGDLDDTEKALVVAHDIVTALPSGQHRPDAGTIVDAMDTANPALLTVCAGNAYARLGRPDRFGDVTADAREAAERAGTDLQPLFRMDEGLAVIRSTDPDPERVAELAREGLALAGPFQTAHVTDRLGLILEAAKPFQTHPVIRDLIEFSAAWRADRGAHPASIA